VEIKNPKSTGGFPTADATLGKSAFNTHEEEVLDIDETDDHAKRTY
jgi:hypothetical protein